MCLRINNYFKEKKARKELLMLDDQTIDMKVKIQGTPHDRKRKYSFELFETMREEIAAGATIMDLVRKYNMSYVTIKYNLDEDYRKAHNAKHKKGTHPVGVMDFDNRVAYKRSLIKTKQVSAIEVL